MFSEKEEILMDKKREKIQKEKIFAKLKNSSHKKKILTDEKDLRKYDKKKRFSQIKSIQKDFHKKKRFSRIKKVLLKKKRFSQMVTSKNKCV